jgi:hypothetical protein
MIVLGGYFLLLPARLDLQGSEGFYTNNDNKNPRGMHARKK